MKKIKIVKETLKESVADRFLEKNLGFPDEFEDFERKYAKMQMKKEKKDDGHDEIVYKESDWALVKNPSSIKYLGPGARGVIFKNGDVYMECYGGKRIHNEILKILFQKGILKGEFNAGWGTKFPQETGFLTVQRYKDTPYIAIGESNKAIYKFDNWEDEMHRYENFINKAKEKNPNLEFVNRLVGIKYFKPQTWEEKEPIAMSEGALSNLFKK
jgi:hypothetical protein